MIREKVEIPNRISFSKKTRLEVLLKTNGRCARCLIRLNDAFDVDHIIPRANGGSNGIENLQALCEPCHDGHKTPGDRKSIAKASRAAKKFGVDYDPDQPRPVSRLKSAGFNRDLSRGFDGKVRKRKQPRN